MRVHAIFLAAVLAATPVCAAEPVATDGSHGFDFEFGRWRVKHHVKRPDGTWVDYTGTSDDRPLMDGSANVEDNTFHKPDGTITRGVALRAFDAKTGLWAIWWIDGRNPHAPLDPPAKGRFENGVGTFSSETTANGVTTIGRLIWKDITANTAHWEQATSTDGGKTWDTNWTMEFERAP